MIDGRLLLAFGIIGAGLEFFMAAKAARRPVRPAEPGMLTTNPATAALVLRVSGAAFLLMFIALGFGIVPSAGIAPIQLH